MSDLLSLTCWLLFLHVTSESAWSVCTHIQNELHFHSKESNTISSKTIVSQNWCILSKDDEYVKFSIFSEVYDGSIFATSELKTELPELR